MNFLDSWGYLQCSSLHLEDIRSFYAIISPLINHSFSDCLSRLKCHVLSCVWFCDPVDGSVPDSSVHGLFQARILEWVAISSPRESSWPRDWTWLSHVSWTAGGFFTCWVNFSDYNMPCFFSQMLLGQTQWSTGVISFMIWPYSNARAWYWVTVFTKLFKAVSRRQGYTMEKRLPLQLHSLTSYIKHT